MSFLYPIMLAGMAALALPLILHLIARQKFPVMDFPTIRLLQGEKRTNTIALRLVDIGQLLLRLLVLALLILAMARLFVHWLPSQLATRNTVIVIDGSASMMQLVDKPDGKGKITIFELARQRAASILNDVNAPSRASVIIAGGKAAIVAPLEPGHERALASLGAIRPYDACGNGLVEAVASACDMLSGRREVNSQIIVLTDLKRSSFDYRSLGDLHRIEETRAALGDSLQMVFVDLAPSATENLGITDAYVRGRKVRSGADAHVISTVTNTGAHEQTTKVKLTVGDVDTVSKAIKIAPGARAVVDVTSPVNRSMRSFARVSIDPDDCPFDDQYSVPLPVVDSRRVLVVNGQGQAGGGAGDPGGAMAKLNPADANKTSHEPEIDGATILKFVLNPGRELNSASNSGIDPVMVTPEAVAVQPLSKYEVVILYDVSSLPGPADRPDQVMNDLATFVSEGRSLLIICSGKTNAGQFNKTLAAESKDRPALAPAELESNEIDSRTPMDIALKDNTHPIVSAFADPRHGDLSVIHFEKIRRLRLLPGDSKNPADHFPDGTRVILQTAGEHPQPLALERQLGRGRIILFTFGFELDRGNIARTRVFPPLMWRVADYLTGRLRVLPPDQLIARTPAALDVSETNFALASDLELVHADAALPAATQPAAHTAQQPAAAAYAAPGGDAWPQACFGAMKQQASRYVLTPSADRTVMLDGLAPGRYLLEKARDPDEKGAVLGYARGVTVQSDPRASDMARVSPDEISSLFAPLELHDSHAPADSQSDFRWGRSPGRAVKLPALAALFDAHLHTVTGEVPAYLVESGGEFWKIFVIALLIAYAVEAIVGFLATARRERERAPGKEVAP